MMYRLAEERTRRLLAAGGKDLFQGGKKGLEKESLRVARDGGVAMTPHPQAWGSPLTHPYITTDYSEALTELITPPHEEVADTIDFLDDLHRFMYEHFPEDELLWAGSMPCAVGEDQGIPIAQYGTSNIGRMKHVYRVGLDYRYGRRMQAISGVHFNYSLPGRLWPVLQEQQKAADLRNLVDTSYFALIRNVHRYGWLIPLVFGNSPAVCKSFLAGRTSRFKRFDSGTYYLPYATSLRMSDIGYKNKNQAVLDISYDNLDSYVSSLRRAIETPYPEYEAIGVKDRNEYIQLNTNVLQIENEYYSFVRPKQHTGSAEKPTTALRKRGVEYVEVRALDVNPFSTTGVDESQLRFVEAFLIFCLLEDSPPISAAERSAIEYNELTVALRGRDPQAELQTGHERLPVRQWAQAICSAMVAICEALDNDLGDKPYAAALSEQARAIADFSELPSARFLDQMHDSGLPFAVYTMELSERNEQHFRSRRLAAEKTQQFRAMAAESIAEQTKLEQSDECPFDEYLRRYFASGS